MTSKSVGSSTLRFARRAVYCLPGPGKEARGGEDAFYCTSSSLGVADGVGSWESEGVDPSLYPRKLMASALRASALPRKQLDRASEFPPLAILDLAYREAAQSRLMGSCTAVVSSMIDDNRLGVLNVGDSGLRIVRDGKLFFGTTELQWRFNCPHQLGPTSRDTPAGGERSILTLHDGDVVVLGTDGLFDNVYDEDIVKIVAPLGEDYRKQKEAGQQKPSTEITASTIAEKLARYAKSLSFNRSGASPFARNAATAGHFYQGGKPDDITVVVALAQSVNIAAAAEDKATSLGGSSDASDSNDGSVSAEQMVEAAASMNEEKCPLLVEEFFLAKGLTMKSTSSGNERSGGGGGWRSRL